MSLDINKEKTSALSSAAQFDIINFSIQNAEEDGFLNSFIFERALYCFAAIVLNDDRKDEISSLVAKGVIEAWEQLIEDGTMDELIKNYAEALDDLSENAQRWFEEYQKYTTSARGLLNNIQELSGSILQNSVQQLYDASSETGVLDILKIADEWGMNNKLPVAEKEEIKPDDSLL